MKNVLAAMTILMISNSSFAVDELYHEMLEKHATSGHIAKEDVANQELGILKSKNSKTNLGEAVRGVASSISVKPQSIKIINPAIEISTK